MLGSRRRMWLAVCGAWLVLALVTAVQNLAFLSWRGADDLAILDAVLVEMLVFGVWAGLTPVIVWAAKRRRVVLHVFMVVVVSLVRNVTLAAVFTLLDDRDASFVDMLLMLLMRYFSLDIVFYAAIVGAFEALRAARLSADLTRARLDALNGQLQPHFLFNTLHAVSSLIDTDAAAARSTIVRLSDLLRATLDIKTTVVSLEDELALLDRYLDIQRVRFHDRLTVIVDVPDELRAARVPPLVLQPLVENAIRHGIGARPEAGTIVVRATRTGDRLAIVVEDDGIGLAADHAERIGVGTTRARLAVLHGDVRLEPRSGGGTRAIVELPFTTS